MCVTAWCIGSLYRTFTSYLATLTDQTSNVDVQEDTTKQQTNKEQNPLPLVRKRNIPTYRPPLVDEI
jgi:hypothetical protein